MLYIWLAVIVALILVEILSRNLTAACFIVSAVVSAICITFHEEYILQVCVFLILGILLLIFVRPNILPLLKNYEKKTYKKEDKKVETKKSPDIKNDNKKKTNTKKSVKK